MHKANKQAIILGGSIAGLLAARVLSQHFDQVTLIERDALTEGADSRKGAPQGRHIHALLAKGYLTLLTLFPNFKNDLLAAGAVILTVGNALTTTFTPNEVVLRPALSVALAYSV